MGPTKQLERVRAGDFESSGGVRGLAGWPRWFKTTVWANVRRAGVAGDPKALSDLCRAYWYPVYAFIRGLGAGPDEAQDVTQGFLETLLKPGALAVVDPAKGQFRTWLRTCARNYFSNHRKKAARGKYGGGKVLTGLDVENVDKDVRPLLTDDLLTPDQIFDRCWALTATELAMARLAEAYEREGKADLFRDLHGRLSGDEPAQSDADRAASLGKTLVAIRQDRFRANRTLAKRYRELLRAEVAKTVRGDAAIDAELRHLFDGLGLTATAERPKR